MPIDWIFVVPPLDPDFDGRSMWPAALGQLPKEECEHDHAKSVHLKSKILHNLLGSLLVIRYVWLKIRFCSNQLASSPRSLSSFLPSLEWDYLLPARRCNYLLPVQRCNYRLLVQRCNYRLPAQRCNYLLPAQRCNY